MNGEQTDTWTAPLPCLQGSDGAASLFLPPAGTRQTPAHLPYLGVHLGRGAGHKGDGASPEQEEEEVRRLPVHGWVNQAPWE